MIDKSACHNKKTKVTFEKRKTKNKNAGKIKQRQ